MKHILLLFVLIVAGCCSTKTTISVEYVTPTQCEYGTGKIAMSLTK